MLVHKAVGSLHLLDLDLPSTCRCSMTRAMRENRHMESTLHDGDYWASSTGFANIGHVGKKTAAAFHDGHLWVSSTGFQHMPLTWRYSMSKGYFTCAGKEGDRSCIA